jgi:para-nitrobenzyl esterase
MVRVIRNRGLAPARNVRPGSLNGSWALGLLALLLPCAAMAQQVKVTGGTVAGSEAPGGGALLFRGIPFAAPPLGDLRWKAPAPVKPWKGVRADMADVPACTQPDDGWNRRDAERGSEDCLFLDIRTPGLTGKRPVMVWIHGGSNRAGSAHGTVLSRITDHGVVLVAIQYRLGLFGFLSHPGAGVGREETAPGNYALMDQLAALRWVQANIARFGGDPGNVTIFGHSAGAQDVTLLLAAPDGNTLFHKAIAQSGTPGFGLRFRNVQDGFRIGQQLDKLLGTDGSLAALRKQPAAALLAADRKLVDEALPDNGLMWLSTTVDETVLPDSPKALLAKGPKRPLIVGTNRAEFGNEKPDWDREMERSFGYKHVRARELYRTEDARLGPPWLQYGTDWMFRCPAGNTAKLVAKTGAPVWRYELDLKKGGGRTEHSAELPYVFEGIEFGGASVQRYWTNFARTGDPNGAGLPQWPRFEPDTQRHVLFDVQGVHTDAKLRDNVCSLMLESL